MTITGKYGLWALACAVLLSWGCVNESLDECPEEGYGLLFRYSGNGTTDVFDRYIDHVSMYVYDTEGNRVATEEFPRGALAVYRGATFDGFEAGNYTVVCWGNVADYTTLRGAGELDEGRATQSQFAAGGTISDFDSLYYGSRTVYIDPSANRTDTLDFVGAHINIEVNIAGYGDLPGTRVSGQGIIKFENVPVEYDFSMDLTKTGADIYPVWNNDQDPDIITARFNLLRFPDDTDIVLYVLDADGDPRARIGLAEFMAENGISVEGVNEIRLPIYILFRGPDFYVTVDEWHTLPVQPTS